MKTRFSIGTDMRKLPPCSVNGCEHLAGAIVSGVLLCGAHAVEHLKMRAPVRDHVRDPEARRRGAAGRAS